MNKTLCQFPATVLYGSQYQPATDAVANRRLHLAPQREGMSPMSELLTWILDPDYPLVVAILDGVQAAGGCQALDRRHAPAGHRRDRRDA